MQDTAKTSRAAWLEPGLFLLAAATVLFFLFLHFGDLPSGLFVDQVAMGYDARCLDRTLADRNGTFLPLFFPIFADWFSPIPIYAMALTEGVLGATPAANALPSAIFALAMAVGIYFILDRMTGRPVLSRWMALLSLLVPSVFFFARYGYGASFLPGLLVLALNALLRFERLPSWRSAALAGAALGLCAYTYQTGGLMAPLLVAAAAVSFFFYGATRRHLWAFLGAAALLGLPMGVYLLRYPGRLTTRLKVNSAWADSPDRWTTVTRIAHTYYQHFAQFDFLFRTGQHSIAHNAGTGFLPVWLALPFFLGFGSLWLRRKSPFARTLAAAVFLSPVAVSLTLQQDFPHTGRTMQFAPLAVILAGLAIADFVRREGLPRWLPAVALGVALLEGAQDLNLYFDDWAKEQTRSMDGDEGVAIQIVFNQRRKDEPVYMQQEFFDAMGMKLEFFGDLDPVKVRTVGLEGLGFHKRQPGPARPGLLVTLGTEAPPPHSELVGATLPDSKGPPVWRIYRIEKSATDSPFESVAPRRNIPPAQLRH